MESLVMEDVSIRPSKERNDKEQTPLLTLNHLATFNKIIPNFKVKKETVSTKDERSICIELALGNELYQGIGSSLKKAKHNAATNALNGTNLPKPPKKAKQFNPDANTPTVKLNALALLKAMKVSYTLIEKVKIPGKFIPKHQIISQGTGTDNGHPEKFKKFYSHQYIFTIRVDICDYKNEVKSFFGKGSSQQKAKHSAAEIALFHIQIDDLQICNDKTEKQTETINSNNHEKSPITLLYERVNALKYKLKIDLISTKGQPHMPEYEVKIEVNLNSDNLIAFGYGRSKHSAKIKAAVAMLEKLPQKDIETKAKASKPNNNCSKNLALHSVSRLIQIMHAKKMKEPIFTLISCEKTNGRNWAFVIECKIEGQMVTGMGNSKKIAKQQASENMLKLLGYEVKHDGAKDGENTKTIATQTKVKKSSKYQKEKFHSHLSTLKENNE